MNDRLSERMKEIRETSPLEPRWSPDRERAIWETVEHAVHSPPPRRFYSRGLALAAAAVLLAASAFWAGRTSAPEVAMPSEPTAPPEALPAPAPDESNLSAPQATSESPEPRSNAVVRFADGSTATRLDDASELRVLAATSRRTRLGLVRGAARFEVVPQHQPFRVEAGPVAVEVLGTGFEVRHVGDTRVAVRVDHGRVRVSWNSGERMLSAGQAGVFPPLEPPAATQEPATQSSSRAASPRPGPPDEDWRQLADRGEIDAAYRALSASQFAVDDEVAALMDASDVARLSGHPRDAIHPLRRVVEQHPNDPRAASAAFTLGRLQLQTLRQPAAAAEAFSRARQLRPAGPLAVDAMAREVEARGRAGQSERAGRLAERFIAAHPNHPRSRALRRWTIGDANRDDPESSAR